MEVYTSKMLSSESSFLQRCQELFSLHCSRTLKHHKEATDSTDLDAFKAKRNEILEEIRNDKRPSEEKCRFLRIMDALKATEKEILAFIYLFFRCQFFSLHLSPQPIPSHPTIGEIEQFSQLSPKGVWQFLSTDRAPVKEGLIIADEDEYMVGLQIRIQAHILKALSGGELTSDEMLKVDPDSAIGKVLAAEPGSKFDDIALHNVAKAKDASSVDSDDLLDDDDNDDMSIGGVGLKDLLNQMAIDTTNASPLEDDELSSSDKDKTTSHTSELTPYKDDLEYLEDGFKYVIVCAKKCNVMTNAYSEYDPKDPKSKQRIRELDNEIQKLSRKFERRVEMTRQAGRFIPKLESLVKLRKLDSFEKKTLLTSVAVVLSHEFKKAIAYTNSSVLTVGLLLDMFCSTLPEQMKSRKAFYRKAKLIKDGFLIANFPYNNARQDLSYMTIELDRRVLDLLTGLDTEIDDLVEGSICYRPDVSISQVVLPSNHRSLLVDTVDSFSRCTAVRDAVGLNDVLRYGRGLVLLFYGPSGTGKTMTANAVANHLGMRLLLLNFKQIKSIAEGQVASLFREAELQNAIVFFDECDMMLETREQNKLVLALLTEIERFEGIIILATNRPTSIDEAMHRRVSLALEFEMPNPLQRLDIWKNHTPKDLPIGDVDFNQLAMDFELTGGFIKNAMLQAISFAVSRAEKQKQKREIEIEASNSNNKEEKLTKIRKEVTDEAHICKDECDNNNTIDDNNNISNMNNDQNTDDNNSDNNNNSSNSKIDDGNVNGNADNNDDDEKITSPVSPSTASCLEGVTLAQDDFVKACRLQVRGRLQMVELDRRVVPDRTLDQVVLPKKTKEQVDELIEFAKARTILLSTWGFEAFKSKGTVCAILGPSGCGKRILAESIGDAMGRPLQILSCSQLIQLRANTFKGAPALEAMFQDARNAGAIICISNAELLVQSDENITVRNIIRQIANFPGMLLMLMEPNKAEEEVFKVRLSRYTQFVIDIPFPATNERTQLWKSQIPSEAPVSSDVNFKNLGDTYELNGRQIGQCILRAAAKAALRSDPNRKIRMKDLKAAAEIETERSRIAPAFGMYV